MPDYGRKKAPAREKLLRILSDGQWHHHMELLRRGAGVRYSARLYELRRQGYKILTIELDDGRSYRLFSMKKGEPQLKKVKIFLDPSDVSGLLSYDNKFSGALSRRARLEISEAFSRYRKNMMKL